MQQDVQWNPVPQPRRPFRRNRLAGYTHWIIDQFQQGRSVHAVAKTLDVHPATLAKHMKEQGYACPKIKGSQLDALHSDIVGLRKQGLAWREIARRLAIPKSTLASWVKVRKEWLP